MTANREGNLVQLDAFRKRNNLPAPPKPKREKRHIRFGLIGMILASALFTLAAIRGVWSLF